MSGASSGVQFNGRVSAAAGSLTVTRGTVVIGNTAEVGLGTTVQSSGTLQVGSGASGTFAGNIVNNGAVLFSNSASSTYSGVISGAGLVTKSNLILGLGETPDEVRTALVDLRDAGCDIVTITQYLRPSARHHPVERWVHPDEFVEHAHYAEERGFAGVLAGPLVRSSYRAGRLYEQARAAAERR